MESCHVMLYRRFVSSLVRRGDTGLVLHGFPPDVTRSFSNVSCIELEVLVWFLLCGYDVSSCGIFVDDHHGFPLRFTKLRRSKLAEVS